MAAALDDGPEDAHGSTESEYGLREDHAWRWVWQRSIAFCDAAGQRVRVTGSLVDVTARREPEAAWRRSEEELRMSEERLRLALESVSDYAIFTLGVDGRIDSWNVGAERTFGYTVAEIIGQSTTILFTPEDRAAGVPEQEIRTAATRGRAVDERWHVRKDGTRFYVSGVLTPLRQGDTITGYAKVARDLTSQHAAEDALQRAQQELEARVAARTRELAAANAALRLEMAVRHRAEDARRALARELVDAQEEERRRISRELHDQLGQQLTVLGLKLALLQRSGVTDPRVDAELDALATLTKELDEVLDFVVWQLHPTALDDLDLPDALADYVEGWSTHVQIPVDVRIARLDQGGLAAEVGTVAYRVAQEALTNIAKHARAAHVQVTLERHGEHMQLTIRDDGVGFVPVGAGRQVRRGLGLVGMRERARQVDGTLRVDSTAGGGTTVSLTFPLATRANALERDG